MQTVKEAAEENAEKYWVSDSRYKSSIASFNAGVQFAQRWIPVEEEKPELYTPVLVKMSYNFFNMDSFAKDCCYWNGESWINAIRQQHSNGSVTHWRPI